MNSIYIYQDIFTLFSCYSNMLLTLTFQRQLMRQRAMNAVKSVDGKKLSEINLQHIRLTCGKLFRVRCLQKPTEYGLYRDAFNVLCCCYPKTKCRFHYVISLCNVVRLFQTKNDNFQMKNYDMFLISPQYIYYGYPIEAARGRGSN